VECGLWTVVWTVECGLLCGTAAPQCQLRSILTTAVRGLIGHNKTNCTLVYEIGVSKSRSFRPEYGRKPSEAVNSGRPHAGHNRLEKA
jgi:hypothetical protein